MQGAGTMINRRPAALHCAVLAGLFEGRRAPSGAIHCPHAHLHDIDSTLETPQALSASLQSRSAARGPSAPLQPIVALQNNVTTRIVISTAELPASAALLPPPPPLPPAAPEGRPLLAWTR